MSEEQPWLNYNPALTAWPNGKPPMQNLFQSILILQKILSEAGIDSIVIGGIAVAIWGEPRLTRDADLKISLQCQDAERLISVISPDYKFLLPDPTLSIQKQAMLFIQDKFGTRLDLLLADTPYDLMAIKRGKAVEVTPGVTILLCSPEDLVIYKLVSTRQRDHEDAKSVIRRQENKLADKYIISWLKQFEQALDDSTLVAEYKKLKQGK